VLSNILYLISKEGLEIQYYSTIYLILYSILQHWYNFDFRFIVISYTYTFFTLSLQYNYLKDCGAVYFQVVESSVFPMKYDIYFLKYFKEMIKRMISV